MQAFARSRRTAALTSPSMAGSRRFGTTAHRCPARAGNGRVVGPRQAEVPSALAFIAAAFSE